MNSKAIKRILDECSIDYPTSCDNITREAAEQLVASATSGDPAFAAYLTARSAR